MDSIKSDAYRSAYEKAMREAAESGILPSEDELKQINERRDAKLGEDAAKNEINRLAHLKKKYLAS